MTFAVPSFETPSKLFFKRGSMALVRQLTGKRAAILCGENSLGRSGCLVKLEGLLQAAGVESQLFSGISGVPTVLGIESLGGDLEEYEPDWIIAVGGGSVIDHAKGAWIFYEHPDFELDPSAKRVVIPRLRRRARVLCIPTTSGSGSEAGCTLVLRDRQQGIDVPIVSPQLVPDRVILDSALTDSMDPKQTAMSGFSALTQSIESYVSVLHNEFSDSLAVHSARKIFDNLHVACQDGQDREARESLHVGAAMAGLARSNSAVGLCHAFAHTFGARFDVPHGAACALFIVAVMEFNMKAGSRFDALARGLGMDTKEALLVSVYRLRSQVGLPETLQEAGIDLEVIKKERLRLLEHVRQHLCTRSNPRRVHPDDLEQILDLVNHEPEALSSETTVMMDGLS